MNILNRFKTRDTASVDKPLSVPEVQATPMISLRPVRSYLGTNFCHRKCRLCQGVGNFARLRYEFLYPDFVLPSSTRKKVLLSCKRPEHTSDRQSELSLVVWFGGILVSAVLRLFTRNVLSAEVRFRQAGVHFRHST